MTKKSYRVSWIDEHGLNTAWFANATPAKELYIEKKVYGFPVYFARKVSDKLFAYMFDNVESANEFGAALLQFHESDVECRKCGCNCSKTERAICLAEMNGK